LSENKDKLTLLAEKLLSAEVIFKEDLVDIFGKRPWEKEEDQIEFVASSEKPLIESPESENSEDVSISDEPKTEVQEDKSGEENTASEENTES
jgi:cell division protease FtsH